MHKLIKLQMPVVYKVLMASVCQLPLHHADILHDRLKLFPFMTDMVLYILITSYLNTLVIKGIT